METIIHQNKIKDNHQSNPFNDSLIEVYREAVEETQNLRKVAHDNGLSITIKGVKELT